jgi:tRNA-specific 2-thiouridylase
MSERVIVAMSGGVDSSLVAALLADQGYEVIGVTLHLWDQPDNAKRGRCCAPEDVRDARRVADQLGIAHYAFDRRELFARQIVEPFVEAYLSGRTPSPCTQCNLYIKLPALDRVAVQMGATKVATGHYAQVLLDPNGHYRIARGVDRHKDQSYFLYALSQAALSRLSLPLGTMTKPQVRQLALARGLVGAAKGESQDLCFVPDGTCGDFVEAHAKDRVRPGLILDDSGAVLGRHDGVHRFTVGQRKGLGIAAGRPVFVTHIDSSSACVIVGDVDALLAKEVRVKSPTLAPGLRLPMRANVRVRYRHEGEMALLVMDGDELRILFECPVRAATCGQAAVAFDDELVVGGGVITSVVPA